jgi:V8-like Glu-specific endopeptidase
VVLSQHPKNKSSFQGTGFLISKDLVLTCAHNICNIQSGKKKHEFIKFYPSAHGKLNKYHKATIAYIPDEYFIIGCKPLAPFDYALLKLDEPVSQA